MSIENLLLRRGTILDMGLEHIYLSVLPSNYNFTTGNEFKFSVVFTPVLTPISPNDITLKSYPTLRYWPSIVNSLSFKLEIENLGIYDTEVEKIDESLGTAIWECFFSNDTPVTSDNSEQFSDKMKSFPENEISDYIDKMYLYIQQSIQDQESDFYCFSKKPIVLDSNISAISGKPLELELQAYLSPNSIFDFTVVQPPEYGEFREIESDGHDRYLYIPDSGFAGITHLRYQASADHGTKSNVATITITVFPDSQSFESHVSNNDSNKEHKRANYDDIVTPCLTDILINNNNRDRLDKIVSELDNGQTLDKIPKDKVNFFRLQKVYEDLNKNSQGGTDNPSDSFNNPSSLEFHEIIEHLHQRRVIMKKIGLVLNFKVAIQEGQFIPSRGRIRLYSDHSENFEFKKLWTPYSYFVDSNNQKLFTLDWSKSNKFSTGLVKMNSLTHSIITKDIVGTSLKLLNVSRSESELNTQHDNLINNSQKINTIQSIGFSIIEKGRLKNFQSEFKKFTIRNDYFLKSTNLDEQPDEHDIDELIIGNRIDVREEKDGEWRSLCRRNEEYEIIEKRIKFMSNDVEGMISITTSEADGKEFEERSSHLAESIFRWSGWSLTVNPIGKTIGVSELPDNLNNIQLSNLLLATNKLSTRFSVVKESLPILRFGRSYQFRSRIVDLAGNGPSYSDALDDEYILPEDGPVKYYRYEPVPSPIIVFTDKASLTYPGELVDVMVIRSLAEDKKSTDDPNQYNSFSERHIGPPKISQQMAEYHGMFDNNDWYRDDDDLYEKLIAKEGSISPNSVQTGATLKIPYLPDPLAFGTIFHDLYWEEEGSLTNFVKFTGKWPENESFKIKIVNGKTEKIEFNQRVLKITLPRGSIKEITFSTMISNDNLELMALYSLAVNDEKFASDKKAFDRFRQLSAAGMNWLLTPPKKIRIVHADTKPQTNPKFEELEIVDRIEHQANATMNARLSIHKNSCDKVNIEALWVERIYDIKNSNGFTDVPKSAIVWEKHDIEYPTNPEEDGIIDISSHSQVFKDTKYRHVCYKIVASTRFREFYLEPPNQDTFFTKESSLEERDVPNSFAPEPPNIKCIIPSFRWVEDKSGRSSARFSSLRIYIEGSWYDSGIGELLGIILFNESSSSLTLANYENFVTQWGIDPIWSSYALSTKKYPKTDHFKNHDLVIENLEIREPVSLEKLSVSIVGYSMKFDPTRGLWYCDMQIENYSSYFPFIKLSLVRLQPNSINLCHCSNMVYSNFTQLSPDRFASVIPNNENGNNTLSVFVSGITPTGPNSIKMEAILEARPRLSNENLWVEIDKKSLYYVDNLSSERVSTWFFDFVLTEDLKNDLLRIRITEYEEYLLDKESSVKGNRLIYSSILRLE